MKRSIIIGSVLVLVVILSSCKKEVFEPNNRSTGVECGDDLNHRGLKSEGTTSTAGSAGEITDPNDDDYTKRPTKTKK